MGHVKRRLEQKLLLRGSCDFDEPAEYGELLPRCSVPSMPTGSGARAGVRVAGHLACLPISQITKLLTVPVCVAPARIECGRSVYSVPRALIGASGQRCGCT